MHKKTTEPGFPAPQGLYHPEFEHSSCGVGFIANIKGVPSHQVVQDALQVVHNFRHRGASGADSELGDGAGLMFQIPDVFFQAQATTLGFSLPAAGEYGVGMVFLPTDTTKKSVVIQAISKEIQKTGLTILGWRDVPTHPDCLSDQGRLLCPAIAQVFVGADNIPTTRNVLASDGFYCANPFEKKLYFLSRQITHTLQKNHPNWGSIASLSANTVVYKGMLTPIQLQQFYPDLHDSAFQSAAVQFHVRFSTNTFPSWRLAQPFQMVAHNGEINTIRGNYNWMQARQKSLAGALQQQGLPHNVPLLDSDGSDSEMLDQTARFLASNGRSLSHSMRMLIPAVWENLQGNHQSNMQGFYRYHASLIEPWDGPAAMAFFDGHTIGGLLDRNGLRPARILITHDHRIVMASEAGVLPVTDEQVKSRARLRPGEIIAVDLDRGQILSNEDLQQNWTAAQDYQQWMDKRLISLNTLLPASSVESSVEVVEKPDVQQLQLFGYTKEDFRFVLPTMARDGAEEIGSMGCDIPIAVLSEQPRLLFDYFRQNFAQVTNPAIDSIREALVMSLSNTITANSTLLDIVPGEAPVLEIPHPVLTKTQWEALISIKDPHFSAHTFSCCFSVEEGSAGMEKSLESLLNQVEQAVHSGANLLILSDRDASAKQVPIPSLLYTSAVHHHLIQIGKRTNVGVLVETGEAREVQHMALLIGYGANAIYPWLALQCIQQMPQAAELSTIEREVNYQKALSKGLLKVFSKMGISTLQSYHGGQIFENLGIQRSVIDRFFTGTHSRLGGLSLNEIAKETLERFAHAFPSQTASTPFLAVGGRYQYRRDGEKHAIHPAMVHQLQLAVRKNDQSAYDRFAKLVNQQDNEQGFLRGFFDFKPNPIPIEQVEQASNIMRRFCTGAMSLGSISRETHEDLAIAMNRINGKSNTGEGGEDASRFTPDSNGDDRNSRIKQVASGRFGVNSHYLSNASEIQIKISQGAKPGEGGQLPGYKVDQYIGSIRFTTPGVGLISPPPHHDIYSIEDIKQLIFDLKNANPKANISVKLVSEIGVGTVAAGVVKAKADLVLISGHEGGTGASPISSIQYAGIPWELGLAETQQTLVLNNLRSRVRLQTDGQLKTGRDVAIAALLGAEEYGFSILPLITLGCVMMRVCHLNTCPVGIATQDKSLREKYQGDPEYIVRYFTMVAEETRQYMALMGFRTLDEMVGRTDCMTIKQLDTHWKAAGLDLSPILHQPNQSNGQLPVLHSTEKQDHELDNVLDQQLIVHAAAALEKGQSVYKALPIHNTDRTSGTMLGHEVTTRYGAVGLPDNTIHFDFHGSAGQSFGAFLPKGITLSLHGETNDYTGKGLCGGKLVIAHPEASSYPKHQNILIGNVALYGATNGELFVGGMGGERFAVRNSGANAVIEGVGDHGCEYMTGGRVLILGETGINFAAGMSGGIAYVLDIAQTFKARCNQEMVLLESFDEDDFSFTKSLLEKHVLYTKSTYAAELLQNWAQYHHSLIKVIPIDYKRVLASQAQATKTKSA